MSYDIWKTSAPTAQEDGLFICGDNCGWRGYFRYAEDAPEFCPDCGESTQEGNVQEYYDDMEADDADRRYQAMKEGDF